MVLGRLPWRMSLSVFLFSERRGSEGELLSARGHMTALSDTCRLILRGLHTDAPCSTWQTLTCGLGPGRAPRAACYFAVTTGLLSWLLYWCSHAQTPSSPFSLGFSFTFVVFAASYFLVHAHESNMAVAAGRIYWNLAEHWKEFVFEHGAEVRWSQDAFVCGWLLKTLNVFILPFVPVKCSCNNLFGFNWFWLVGSAGHLTNFTPTSPEDGALSP